MAMLLISMGLAFLATVRVTRLMVSDRITLTYRQWVQKRWGDSSLAAYWAHCPWCTSIWVSALVMPGAILFPNRWVMAVLAIPAASLVAGLILDRE